MATRVTDQDPLDLLARAEKFREFARLAAQAAQASSNENLRAEYLRIATEWLKLASEVDDLYHCKSAC